MRRKIDKKAAARQAGLRIMESGHCAQATLHNIHNLIGLDDIEELIIATSGLAGGIGHQGATCGILTSGALVLEIAGKHLQEDEQDRAVRSSMDVNDFVQKFKKQVGSSQCDRITEVDFKNDSQVRRYALVGAVQCLKHMAQGSAMIADILNRSHHSPAPIFYKLHRWFSDNGFHCAQFTIRRVLEEIKSTPRFPVNMFIPLNGGIGYSGDSCSALLGGCLAIGLIRGGDSSQGGIPAQLHRMAKMVTQGSAAFKNVNLSPSADPLVQSSELFSWFKERFSTHLCCKITDTDFLNAKQAEQFFSGDAVSRCKAIAEEAALKTLELCC